MATTLFAGSVAIVSYNADDQDTFDDTLRFVVLTDIESGTQISCTDRDWNGSSVGGGEGTYTYAAPGAVAAGTVLMSNHYGFGA